MKVFITRKIPEEGIKILEDAGLEVSVFSDDRIPSKGEIINGIKNVDALISLLTDPIDCDVIESGKKLKVIGNYAVGYNNIDLKCAKRRGIKVVNTPGVLTETTADLTFALILAASRRIVEGYDIIRKGEFKGWAPLFLLGKEVYGSTLGILGAGRIGQAVGRRAKGFGMRILYSSRSKKPQFEKETNAKFVSLDELLRNSDILTIHVPLTNETYHLISDEEIKMMKDGVILVNTARGEIIDEKALVKFLHRGKFFAVALDVFENEPNVNPELLKFNNVLITPHIGSATEKTRKKMAEIVCADVLRVLKGEEPLHRVV